MLLQEEVHLRSLRFRALPLREHGRNLGHKTRPDGPFGCRSGEPAAVPGPSHIKLTLGPRHGDIAEPALFFELGDRVPAPAVWKKVLLHAGDKHDRELE